MFPPYMYLPARSSGGASSAGPLRAPPKWVRLENNGLHVPRGSVITLSKTVTLTAGAGKEIFIENGVTFKIAPGAGLIIKSNLHVMGTEERPVRFVSLTDKPWSGLFAGKDRERIDVSVKNAVFDNFGVFPKTSIGGLKLNGGLTILRGNLKMEKVEITNARSEDALNLIHSTADLRDILVTGSFSDGIDMDFSDARIQRLTMEHIGGDGLDLSNSIVLCLDSVFSGSADKGISMGEMSHVVINNSKFTGNAIGIANKDQSSLRAEGSLFEDNGVAISEFIKKPWFGRPEKLLKRNTYRHNNKRYVWRGFYTY